jgi:general nucleoside transport system ATP-binding protein
MTETARAVPAVELRGITKAFPGVVANQDIDLDLWPGEIHCLLGENGAGKSTLMQILSGMYRPDAGSISVGGERVVIESPARALSLGIGMVYQHPSLVSTFTVLENLLLSARGPFRLDRRGAGARFHKLAARLGSSVEPDAVAGSLELGRQQQVEILKALWADSRVLILDEPTSMLTPQEVADLGQVLSSLRGEGLAVVLITHKLREALALGDRITVLREGRIAGCVDLERVRSSSPEELQDTVVQMMFGGEASGSALVAELAMGDPAHRRSLALPAEPVLEVDAISVEPGRQEAGLDDVSFSIRRGEIFGIAGVDGNGQRELAEVIAGQRDLSAGGLRLAGHALAGLDVKERQRLGLRYVTDDRMGEGLVPSFPISLNLLLKRIGQRPFWKAGRLIPGAVTENAERLIADFDIRTPGAQTPAENLSGGNIQKTVLARELGPGAAVVVFNKPTSGLDLKTTAAIRQRIRALSDEGVSALLISSDLEELIDLCDRIAVMHKGHLVGVIDNEGPEVRQRVGALMVGVGDEGAPGRVAPAAVGAVR